MCPAGWPQGLGHCQEGRVQRHPVYRRPPIGVNEVTGGRHERHRVAAFETSYLRGAMRHAEQLPVCPFVLLHPWHHIVSCLAVGTHTHTHCHTATLSEPQSLNCLRCLLLAHFVPLRLELSQVRTYHHVLPCLDLYCIVLVSLVLLFSSFSCHVSSWACLGVLELELRRRLLRHWDWCFAACLAVDTDFALAQG